MFQSANYILTKLAFLIKPLYKGFIHQQPSLKFTPETPMCWIGNSAKGNDILQGHYHWHGHNAYQSQCPWYVENAPQSWWEYAHSFDWLYDVATSNDTQKQQKALQWIFLWDKYYPAPSDKIAWRADIVGRRINVLTAHWGFLRYSLSMTDKEKIADIINSHYHHLGFIEDTPKDPLQRITTLRALIVTDAIISEGKMQTSLNWRLQKFIDFLHKFIKEDGFNKWMHIPTQVSILKSCIMVRSSLYKVELPIPQDLDNIIKQLAQVLQFFVGPNKNIINMAAGYTNTISFERILELANTKGYPSILQNSGMYRHKQKKTTLFFDGGTRSLTKNDTMGLLAMELHYGTIPFIVNCGFAPTQDHPMHEPLCSLGAFSSLGIEGKSPVIDWQYSNTHKIEAIEDWTLLKASHSGYTNIGYADKVQRSIAISPDGLTIIGKDILKNILGIYSFIVRFHLHPNVQVSQTQSPNICIMRSKNHAFKLEVENGDISIEPSIYYTHNQNKQSTHQIVIRQQTTNAKQEINWKIYYIPSK